MVVAKIIYSPQQVFCFVLCFCFCFFFSLKAVLNIVLIPSPSSCWLLRLLVFSFALLRVLFTLSHQKAARAPWIWWEWSGSGVVVMYHNTSGKRHRSHNSWIGRAPRASCQPFREACMHTCTHTHTHAHASVLPGPLVIKFGAFPAFMGRVSLLFFKETSGSTWKWYLCA